MATSYISEHSAEYYLVPALKRILESEFKFVSPVFPWLTREFSRVSRSIHSGDKFHVLVMFPRRPKVTVDGHGAVNVTINGELLDFKAVGNKHGVPVIAGCPNASSFWELANCRDFVWIDVEETRLSQYLIPISPANNGSGWLTKRSIIQMTKKSAVLNLSSFENFLREAQESQPDNGYGGHYKPVYFLMKN